jgi:hypothetical protein
MAGGFHRRRVSPKNPIRFLPEEFCALWAFGYESVAGLASRVLAGAACAKPGPIPGSVRGWGMPEILDETCAGRSSGVASCIMDKVW